AALAARRPGRAGPTDGPEKEDAAGTTEVSRRLFACTGALSGRECRRPAEWVPGEKGRPVGRRPRKKAGEGTGFAAASFVTGSVVGTTVGLFAGYLCGWSLWAVSNRGGRDGNGPDA